MVVEEFGPPVAASEEIPTFRPNQDSRRLNRRGPQECESIGSTRGAGGRLKNLRLVGLAAVIAITSAVGLPSGAAPGMQPTGLPAVRSGHRPGPDILYRPLAVAPQLDNAAPWTAAPILVSGYYSPRHMYLASTTAARVCRIRTLRSDRVHSCSRQPPARSRIPRTRCTRTTLPTWSSSGSSRSPERPLSA